MLYFDFVGDFLDSRRPHAVEQLHHLAVERFSVCTKEDLHIGIPLVEREETRHHVTVSHHFLIEVDDAVGIYKQTEMIPRIGRRRRLSSRWDDRWQVHADAFHVNLAQANHHETGQKKEHDIDQRNDFDAGSFFWHWRIDSHSIRFRLKLGALHRVGNRHSDPVICARLATPATERVNGSLVENRASSALGD